MISNKPIILYHSSILFAGGAERLLFEEYCYLKKLGYRVKLLTFEVNNEALFNYDVDDLEIIHSKHHLLTRAIALRKKLQENNAGMVISATGLPELFFATAGSGIPYFLHLHGSLFWFEDDVLKYSLIHKPVFNLIQSSVRGHKEFIASKPEIRGFKRIKLELDAILDYLVVRKAKNIIVLTPQVKWEVSQLYNKESTIARGCLSSNIFQHNPKQNIRNKLGIANDTKIVLSVSRLDPRKRLDVLIKAFCKLLKDGHNIMLIIGGNGPDKQRLVSLTSKLGCSQKVLFTGMIPDNELWDYYFACDVFAFPGWTTSPITTYEALAFQKNVVWTTEASEPFEIMHNEHVFKANPDTDSFASALLKAIETKTKENIDLNNYTWTNYFAQVCKAVGLSTDLALKTTIYSNKPKNNRA